MIFSHGLGGTRNAYSHLTGSLASHGMVVVAPEHRDGSSPISYIHDENGSPPKAVDYRFLPHKPSLEVDEGRNDQLKIRLWELGLVHEALLKLDRGEKITNVAPESHQKTDLSMFASSLDVFTPGKISWAGHSFGAATVVQFVKSVFYRSSDHMNGDKPLFAPSPDSTVSSQITPSSPVTVLDLWTQPILSRSTSFLLEQPLPAYKGAGGSPPLAILSEAFFKWTNNLQDTKRAISPPDDEKSPPTIKPHLFYPIGSAHLSQSDFGPLLPWATKKIFKAKDPERTMRLNVRAILESLRRSGVQVADTSRLDMELEGEQNGDASTSPGQDHQILATDGSVKGWIAIPLDDDKDMANANGHAVKAEDPSDAVIQGEVMKE